MNLNNHSKCILSFLAKIY